MTKRQKEELARYCFGISQLCVGSLGFNIFTEQTVDKIILTVSGLTLAGAFLKIGVKLLKDV